eukprot:TRINITY_DN67858_c12_g4_i1.p1 TRINITY_DN67858_c12_g4~~TRINITY_DN67858_c12_g4_i1.p1  ORF type:complete len:237 (+),score=32.46 TRINITY_DN67858_c12_g4_i1:44-754(+)
MRTTVVVVVVVYLMVTETAKSKKKRKNSNDNIDPALLAEAQKCRACESMIDRIETMMKTTPHEKPILSHRLDKNNKRVHLDGATAEARAMDITEEACDDAGPGEKYHCEMALTENEDELIEYIKHNKQDKAVKDKICQPSCQLKNAMQNQMKELHDKLKPGSWSAIWWVLENSKMMAGALAVAVAVLFMLAYQVYQLSVEMSNAPTKETQDQNFAEQMKKSRLKQQERYEVKPHNE